MEKQENTGGSHMSTNTAARRIALLSSSSLGLAAIVSAAATVTAFIPTAAWAANECGIQAGSAPIVCNATSYSPGITYDANGDLVIIFTAATMEVEDDGINLTADGSESITFDSATANSELESRDTVGPLLDVSTVNGNIIIRTEEMDADGQNPNGVTHAVRAISTGGGDVTISTTANVDVQGSSNPIGSIGIEARSFGGGDVTVSNTSDILGNGYGVLASVEGPGALTLNLTDRVIIDDDGIAAIDVATGSGDLLVNLVDVAVDGAGGSGLRVRSAGDAEIRLDEEAEIAADTRSSPTNWAIEAVIDAGVLTINNEFGFIDSNAYSGRAITAAGAGALVINNDSAITGQVDFSGLIQGVMFNITGRYGPSANSGGWQSSGASEFSVGDDILRTSGEGGVFTSGIASSTLQTPQPIGGIATEIDFGSGEDLFDNAGRLVVGAGNNCLDNPTLPSSSGCNLRETVTTFTGLEVFQNSGVIYMGAQLTPDFVGQELSDYQPNDRLIMPGTRYIGDGGRIEMDIDFGNGAGQASCVGSTISEALFYAAADCIDLSGGSTEGETLVLLRMANYPGTGPRLRDNTVATYFRTGLRGGYIPDGIVIVDVSGGTSEAGDFRIDPDSLLYSSAHGGVIDEGLFVYALVFDEDASQHKVVSLAGGAAQLGPMAEVTQGLWRSASGSWFQRRSELRDQTGAEGTGLWVRTTAASAERDLVRTERPSGAAFVFDDSYQTDSYGLTAGVDLAAGESYGFGFMFGYGHAGMDFDEGPNHATFDAVAAGVYGGVASGPFFLDAAVTATRTEIGSYMPALGLDAVEIDIGSGQIVPAFDTGSAEWATNVLSLGARIEAGWRLPLGERAFVEPLAGLDYVRTVFDDISVRAPSEPSSEATAPPVLVRYDDAVNLRGSVGGRVALESVVGPVNVRWSLVGRIGNEFEGETRYLVDNPGADLWLANDTGGRFSEVVGALNVFDDGGAVSGFLTVGGEFADGYRSLSASLGGRFRF